MEEGKLSILHQLDGPADYLAALARQRGVGVGSSLALKVPLEPWDPRPKGPPPGQKKSSLVALILDPREGRSLHTASLVQELRKQGHSVCVFIPPSREEEWPCRSLLQQAGAWVATSLESILALLVLLRDRGIPLKGPRALVEVPDPHLRAILRDAMSRAGLRPVSAEPADFSISLFPDCRKKTPTKARKGIPCFNLWPFAVGPERPEMFSLAERIEAIRALLWFSTHASPGEAEAPSAPAIPNRREVESVLSGPARLLSLSTGLRFMSALEIPVPPFHLCTSVSAAARMGQDLGWPVELHLSAAGLEPGDPLSAPFRALSSPASVRAAFAQLAASAEDRGMQVLGAVVMPVASGLEASLDAMEREGEGILFRLEVGASAPAVKRAPLSMRDASELAVDAGAPEPSIRELAMTLCKLSGLVVKEPGRLARIRLERILLEPSFLVARPYLWTSGEEDL